MNIYMYLCFCLIIASQLADGASTITTGAATATTATTPTTSTTQGGSQAQTTSSPTARPTMGVSLTANVGVIVPALTRDLALTCTFPPPADVGMDSIVSMVVSKQESSRPNKQDIAKLKISSPKVVTKLYDVGAGLSGQLDPTGQSFIRLDWSYPGTNEVGLYACEVTVLNAGGHPVTMERSFRVTSKSADLSALIDQFRLFTREQDLSAANRRNFIVQNMFDVSPVTNGVQYLSSRMDFQDVHVAEMEYVRIFATYLANIETLCNLTGGHLADIRDSAELSMVKAFVQSLPHRSSRFSQILFSPTDENQEGRWVYRHSGEAVKDAVPWDSLYPSSSTNQNCAVLNRRNWQAYDIVCYNRPNINFICQRKASI